MGAGSDRWPQQKSSFAVAWRTTWAPPTAAGGGCAKARPADRRWIRPKALKRSDAEEAGVVHATGPAKTKTAREDIIGAAIARDRARTAAADPGERLRRWRPLTRARWTLVDSFERSGARYIVARENQSRFEGLESLTDRERQAVVYLAVGQSTKETAYALGISDVTVRVLLARAATKLGVRSRAELLAHDEVRPLCPGKTTPVT